MFCGVAISRQYLIRSRELSKRHQFRKSVRARSEQMSDRLRQLQHKDFTNDIIQMMFYKPFHHCLFYFRPWRSVYFSWKLWRLPITVHVKVINSVLVIFWYFKLAHALMALNYCTRMELQTVDNKSTSNDSNYPFKTSTKKCTFFKEFIGPEWEPQKSMYTMYLKVKQFSCSFIWKKKRFKINFRSFNAAK